MRIRNFGSAAVMFAAATVVACGPSRQNNDAGVDGGTFPPGCVGVCNPQDAGTDGGTNNNGDGGMTGTDGGMECPPYDGGLVKTVEDIRTAGKCDLPFGTKVELQDVVVNSVGSVFTGSQGDTIAEFWVVDPADPTQGVFVRKFYTDDPGPYVPQRGDKVTVTGWFGTEKPFYDRFGYRRVVKSQFDFVMSGAQPLNISAPVPVTPPTPLSVTAGNFGNSDGGTTRPNSEYAGGLVHIEGPVEIVNHSPEAMKRISAAPNDSVHFGFEITGGILVNNNSTFRADGGCPWRDVAIDAGMNGQKVVFTGGITGVWDTYTHAPCQDGGTTSNPTGGCRREFGEVPGTNNDYTYVLYPQDCGDFVGGEVQPQ